MGRLVPEADGFLPAFVAALRLLSDAEEEVAAASQPRPVLVGGAAVELWTTGRYLSGDLDLLTPDTSAIEAALLARGFRREDRQGWLRRGLYHPELCFGIEFVSGQLFDGRADAARLVLLEFMPGARVLVIPPEDVIADRLGQFAADPAAGGDQLRIARMVFRLAPALDHAYLHGRIQDETDWRLPWERVRRWLTDEDVTISRP